MSENFSNIITQAVRPQKQNSRSNIIFNKQESYKKMCEQQKKSNSFFARLFPFLCCFVSPNFDVDNNPKIQNAELPSTSTAEKYHKVEKPLKTVCPIYRKRKKHFKKFLLGPQDPKFRNKKTLVLDLDETLIHSSFKPVDNPDFIVKVEIDNVIHDVYVLKRPGVDEFLKRMGELYEVVIFTASLSKYADAVIDTLDKHLVVSSRLFRESCSYFEGNYLKDLSKIGRNLNQVIIVDNSPMSYSRQPYNAIPVRTWFDDPTDNHLEEILPWLEKAAFAEDLYSVLEDCREAMGYGV